MQTIHSGFLPPNDQQMGIHTHLQKHNQVMMDQPIHSQRKLTSWPADSVQGVWSGAQTIIPVGGMENTNLGYQHYGHGKNTCTYTIKLRAIPFEILRGGRTGKFHGPPPPPILFFLPTPPHTFYFFW